MKLGPKGYLVIAVVALAAGGAVARSLWMGPWLLEKAAARTAKRVSVEGLLRDGDMIFHTSRSRQSRAVQEATRSQWSHCGILAKRSGQWLVYEAIQPVKSTPLAEWIARGRENRIVVKRLRESVHKLSATDLVKMDSVGKTFAGKSYDALFGWSDERIYCSELIWKIYHRAIGVEIAPVQRLHEFDLTSPAVKILLEKRYGKNVPLQDSVVSPVAIYESPLLETVFENR
ncbi:MAG: YiiX family permuted papain-like enzyme [Fibrobacterota bacterium]